MTPISNFSDVGLFTPTTKASLFKLTQLSSKVFVKKVSTLEQAAACGAVLIKTGSDWLILPGSVISELIAQELWPPKVQPAPRLALEDGFNAKFRPVRVLPGYVVSRSASTTAEFCGVITRAHSVLGWSGISATHPHVGMPTFADVPVRGTSTAIGPQSGHLTYNPAKGAAFTEIHYADHPFGVVDMFNRPETQAALDDWEEGEEYRAEASAFVRALPNMKHPTPLLHVVTPTLQYFGPGLPEQTRLIGLKGASTIVAGSVITNDRPPDLPADKLTTLSARSNWGTMNGAHTYQVKNHEIGSLNGSSASYNTNADIVTTASVNNGQCLWISSCQWGAPSAVNKPSTAVGPLLGGATTINAWTTASTGDGNYTAGAAQVTKVSTGYVLGATVNIVLPWIECLEPLYAIEGSFTSSLDYAGTFPMPDGSTKTGTVNWCVDGVMLNGYYTNELPSTGVPDTISGRPALEVLGGAMPGCYYGANLLPLPAGGASFAAADLIKIDSSMLEVSFAQKSVNTSGMTEAEALEATRGAEYAYAMWEQPTKLSVPSVRTAERWIKPFTHAFGELMVKYYDKVEKLAREKSK